MTKYKQGFFKPNYPEKYKGNPTDIVYRSWWEYQVMSMLDSSKNVIEWGSETIVIPYRSPIDNKLHRYFTDFYVKKKNHSDGKIETVIIEVKPKGQTVPPKVQTNSKKNKKYLNEVKTWGVNSAKWAAAEEYCKARGWKFQILTEDDLGLKK